MPARSLKQTFWDGNDGYEFSRIDNRNRCVCHYWSISSNRYKVGILYREKGVADFFVDGLIADRIIIIHRQHNHLCNYRNHGLYLIMEYT